MKVIYNGGTMSYNGCSDPKGLVVGKIYEVVAKSVGKFQTDYTLKEMDGQFNSVWFDKVEDFPTYLAIGRKVPVAGESYECWRLVINKNVVNSQKAKTSSVRYVELIGKDTYMAITRNSIYVVTIK